MQEPAMSEPQFVHLTLNNNWEHLSYKHGDKAVKIPKEVETIKVMWLDDTVTTEKLVSERYHSIAHDMGHTQDVSGTIHVIEFEHNGARLRMKLSDLKGVALPTGTVTE